MTEHPIADAIARERTALGREATEIRTDLAGMFRGRQPVPAAQAAPATQEDHMTNAAIEDFEHVWDAATAELAKLKAALPADIDKARQLENDPLARIALQLAEHVAAGFLPVSAVGFVVSYAGKALADLIDLYHPQQAAGAAAPVAATGPQQAQAADASATGAAQ